MNDQIFNATDHSVPSALQEHAHTLDAQDPLARHRERFAIPPNLVYLDGNSLGVLPKDVPARLGNVASQEWGQDLIAAWNKHAWMDLPLRVGAKIARLVGANPEEVIATDTTSINIYKVLTAALALRPERRVIVSDVDNFPTDLYMAQGINTLLGETLELRFVKREALGDAIGDDVAVVMLTEVDYRTGEKLNMRAITEKIQAAGAIAIWDLAHSAGAFPVDLNACNVDFAVGCGYKYLNGGPGAPAFLFAAKRHHAQVLPALAGWHGHNAPFAFTPAYEPASDIRRFLVGTPPVLALGALEVALDIWHDVDLHVLRQKSLALTDLFINAMQPLCEQYGFRLVTPLEHEKRGSQVAYAFDDGYAVVQALIAAGVVGDFRAPNIMRFGFTPLYLSHQDVLTAVARLREIMHKGTHLEPRFRHKAKVT